MFFPCLAVALDVTACATGTAGAAPPAFVAGGKAKAE